MIKSFKDQWLEDFFIKNQFISRIPENITDSLFRKLSLLQAAATEKDLRAPPGNCFEKLVGNLAGKYSIRVNRQWRLIFNWDEKQGQAKKVYLDNHEYR